MASWALALISFLNANGFLFDLSLSGWKQIAFVVVQIAVGVG